VVFLDRQASALAEMQGYGPGSRSVQIASFTWLQAFFPSPTPEYFHRRRNLVEISLNHSLQVVHPPFAPGIDAHGQQESHSAQHINGAHLLLTRQSGFHSWNLALSQSRLTIGIRNTIQDNKDTVDCKNADIGVGPVCNLTGNIKQWIDADVPVNGFQYPKRRISLHGFLLPRGGQGATDLGNILTGSKIAGPIKSAPSFAVNP
jgi:hypothetical protein